MFGPAFYIVGALTFICVHSGEALTLEQATSVCALLPDGENIANPLDCSQFYSCWKGKAQLNSCLGSQLFSKEDQTCVPPNESSCGTEDQDPCAYMSDGYFVGVDNSCSEYYYCSGGVGTKGTCGKLNFDQASQSCKYVNELPCTESIPGEENINICQVVRSEMYFASPQSCKSWQKCNSNRPAEIGDCPDAFYFNVDTQACDYKENVSCRQLQGTGTGGSSLEGTSCDQNGEIRAGTACSSYYVCVDNKYALSKCPNNKYFNPKTNTCVSRLNAVNDCDRCEGSKLQFVNLYQDDCVGYAYCHNGKTESTGKCQSGYFSELAGSCVLNGPNPEFPVCYITDDEDNETTEATTTTEAETETDPTPKTDAPKTTTTKKTTTEESTTEESTTKQSTTEKSTTEKSTTEKTTTEKTTTTTTSKPETTETPTTTEESGAEPAVTESEETTESKENETSSED